MQLRLLTLLISGVIAFHGWCFGEKGHKTIAAIARAHLTATARTTAESYLEGSTIVDVASWMDRVRETPEYSFSSKWHAVAFNAKCKLDQSWSPNKSLAHYAINLEMSKVENGRWHEMTDSALAVSIKMLVHLIGDIHTPCHQYYQNKSQSFNIYIKDEEFAFHKFFDSGLMNYVHPGWAYTRYQTDLDKWSEEEIKEVQKGTLTEWEEDNAARMIGLYDILTPDLHVYGTTANNLTDSLMAIEARQLAMAGYRLAHVLNSVFDPEYAPRWDRDGSSGVGDVTVDDDNVPVEYYNLQGVRVREPAPGIYIRRQGSKVVRIMIK